MKKLCEEELAKLPGPTTKTLTGLINPGQEIPFLTTMTETCISSGKLGTSADIYDRLSDRWSHFYARKAVGILSPLVALILFGVTIIVAAAYQLPFGWQNWWISLVFLTIATILNLVFIYPYSGKILAEINFLEMQVVLANLESVRKIIASILTSAEMYKQFLKM